MSASGDIPVLPKAGSSAVVDHRSTDFPSFLSASPDPLHCRFPLDKRVVDLPAALPSSPWHGVCVRSHVCGPDLPEIDRAGSVWVRLLCSKIHLLFYSALLISSIIPPKLPIILSKLPIIPKKV